MISSDSDPLGPLPVLWSPTEEGIAQSSMAAFVEYLDVHHGCDLVADDYQSLHEWSIDDIERFWLVLADFMGLDLDLSDGVLTGDSITAVEKFPSAHINYAEHARRQTDSRSNSYSPVATIDVTGTRKSSLWTSAQI